MKRIIALLLCVALLVTFTACGKDADTDKGTASTTTTTTTVTTTVGESDAVTTTTTTAATAATDGTTASSTEDSTTATTTVTTTTAGTTTGAGAEEPIDPTTATTTTGRPTSTTSKPVSTTTTTKVTTTTSTTVKVPEVVLPAIGSDIDVVKQKNRIRVSAASAVSNADGIIAVSLTFKNYSSNWITEETDWVEYTCYDKDGKVVQAATKIAIGCIDTKRHPVKTFTFDVPAATAEVRLTGSKIVYWTEWS